MKATLLYEPELEFGTDRHIDIRFGLMNYGLLDFDQPLAPKKIKLGIVGTPEAIEGVTTWLEKIRAGVAAKQSKRPNLFPRFPGYGEGEMLHADLLLDPQLQRPIAPRSFVQLCGQARTETVLKELAQLFLDELEYLAQKTTADVLVCAYPQILVDFIDRTEDEKVVDDGDQDEEDDTNLVFRDYLKAQAMRLRKPTQIIRPSTYDESKRGKRRKGSEKKRPLQDEATRAWNLYVALYYKAGGTPWRLIRESTQLSTCYIGVSFYRTLDETLLLTSTAEVFNERGEGVILRGGVAQISKDDRQIHLTSEDAFNLLTNALGVYRREHKNFPARVVVHKSSVHNQEEIDGFERALKSFSIDPDQADFLSITKSSTRLFRANIYPPLRGTFFETGGDEYVLYTKGSVDFFCAYPGMYIPHPLALRCDAHVQTPNFLAQEILTLTKMNWNNTQFDGGDPITLRAARQVGHVLKYLGASDAYEPYYRFYM